VATATGPRRGTWRNTASGEYVAEFLGTFTLIMFGDGVVAMAVAALNQSGRALKSSPPTIFLASGDWLLIVFGWMFAVICGVYVAGGVTGAHINPAVTIANAVKRGFPWGKVPGYILAQVAGAFVAAAVVFWVYHNAIDTYLLNTHAVKKTSLATYSIFATFPAPYFHNFTGPFISELIGSALLIGIVLAVIDNLNLPPKGNLAPWIIGLVVAGIGMSYGANTGYAINPARDFGPRLFAWLAGWDGVALPGNYGNVNWYWWLPIVAPIVGGIIGALVYEFFISHVLRAREEPPASDVEVKGEVVEEL